jgi:hypothetical protein
VRLTPIRERVAAISAAIRERATVINAGIGQGREWIIAKVRREFEWIKPASLAFRARDAQIRAGGGTRLVAGLLWVWSRLRHVLWSSRFAFIPQLILGVILVHITPCQIVLSEKTRLSVYPLQAPDEAEEFLRTLWQVEASVLALSIAVIIFAFQAISSPESGLELYEFAEDTHLFPIFYLGIVGLILDGYVLLGFGSGAPGGGAALVATCVSGLAFPLLAWVFAGTIGVLAPEQLQRRRIKRFRRAARSTVEQEVFERIALNLLEQKCEQMAIDFQPLYAGSPTPGSHEVTAPTGGSVRDINLRRLRFLAYLVRRGGQARVSLQMRVGSRVFEGRTVIVLPPHAGKLARRLAPWVFRIRKERS